MTTPAAGTQTRAAPTIEARGVSKRFGRIQSLSRVDLRVDSGEVLALLGDNGAGKSTLIKILSGVYQPDEGTLLLDGRPAAFHSPHDARAQGIATVFQDLAIVDLLSISRNFFLGAEPTWRLGPLTFMNTALADRVTREALADVGIHIRSASEPAISLSGGERQSIAIARAVYFGARVLILDEPTSALGVREAAKVLTYIANARERGLAVVFITHNLHHAMPVADRFTVLQHGRVAGTFERGGVSEAELSTLMAGGAELETAFQELSQQRPLLAHQTDQEG